MTAQTQSETFIIEVGRATGYFKKKLKHSGSFDELFTIADEMVTVISEFEKQLYEYRGGKVYPRNVLLNKREWLEKINHEK